MFRPQVMVIYIDKNKAKVQESEQEANTLTRHVAGGRDRWVCNLHDL